MAEVEPSVIHSVPVLAHHTIYKQEEGSVIPPENGIFNGNYYLWATSTTACLWWADPAIHSDVVTTRDNYLTSLPWLTWSEQSQTAANVQYLSQACSGLPGVAGCTTVTTFRYDSTRNATYWLTENIQIDPSLTSDQSTRLFVIAHETGHAYGLDERYFENPVACNGTETTVMDALGCRPGVTGPTSLDISRLTSYWEQGTGTQLTVSRVNTVDVSTITAAWHNNAWAVESYAVFWYTSPDGGVTWTLTFSDSTNVNVGIIDSVQSRVLTKSFRQLADTGFVPVMVCVAPYFYRR